MLTDDPAKVHVSFVTASGAVLGEGRHARYGTLRAAAAALLPTGSARHYLHATQVVVDADQQLGAIAGTRVQEVEIVVTVVAPPQTPFHYFRLPFFFNNDSSNSINMSRINHLSCRQHVASTRCE
jgi:hypothetical protein